MACLLDAASSLQLTAQLQAKMPPPASPQRIHSQMVATPVAGQIALFYLHLPVLTSSVAGAYIFKPNGTEGTPGPLSFTVVEGPVVSEVHQHWTNYTSLTARCACSAGAGGA